MRIGVVETVAGPDPAATLLPDLPLRSAVKGVAPGVDFGQAGKRAVRLSYASSEDSRETARPLGEYLERIG